MKTNYNKMGKIEKYLAIDVNDTDLKEEDLDKLAEIGLNLIKNNRKDLINYAVNNFASRIYDKLLEDKINNATFKIEKNKIKILFKKGE